MTFAPAVYIAAAIANQMWERLQDDRFEYFAYPQTEDQLCEWFERSFNGRLTVSEASAAISILDAVGLISFDEDPFAGRFLKADAKSFRTRWHELTKTSSDSPFGKAGEFGEAWFKAVFDNNQFWTELHTDDPAKAIFLLPGGFLRAPEPIVFIVPGSADGEELQSGLQDLEEQLRTNNEIATQLGDERARISSELSASRELIKSGSVRVGALREVILKVLRELARKLKEKSMDLGIERLLDLAIKLIEH